MASTTNQQGLTNYEIRVQGTISRRWLNWLDDIVVLDVADTGSSAMTTAKVSVPDQAALLGKLQQLHNLGFSLVQVRRIS